MANAYVDRWDTTAKGPWKPLVAGDVIVDAAGNPWAIDLTNLPSIPAGKIPNTLVATAEGRLTLTSGTPITTSDVNSSSTLYYTPFIGDKIAIFNGSSVLFYTFPETSLALSGLVIGQAYDVFMYDNSSTLTLETAEWLNATITVTIATPGVMTWTGHGLSTGNTISFTTTGALPTGITVGTIYFITVVDANTFKLSTSLANVASATFVATSGSQSGTHTGHSPTRRQTAVTMQNGSWYKSGAATRRWLGSFVAGNTNAVGMTKQSANVINGFNKVPMPLLVTESTSTWTYSTLTWRQVNASGANSVTILCPHPAGDDWVYLTARAQAINGTGGVRIATGVGIDSTNTNSAQTWGGGTANTTLNVALAEYRGRPGLGRHFMTWLEIATASGTTTWDGNPTAAAQTGMSGFIMG